MMTPSTSSASGADPRIPIILVTGFLGSGKTTLINRLLPTPALAGAAVLVNEFGQIAIDDDLIAARNDTVVELTNGCVCCALNEDLGPALLDIQAQRGDGLSKVVIETTGLANAGPIVQIILGHPEVRKVFVLDQVITTVDAVNGMSNLNIHAESVEQVAVADRLVLTKLDTLANRTDADSLRTRLQSLNHTAQPLDGDAVDPDTLLATKTNPVAGSDPTRYPAAADPAPHHHAPLDDRGRAIRDDAARHDPHIHSFCLVRDDPMPQMSLDRFWAALNTESGPNLLRVKGIVNVAERPATPAVLQGVQDVLETPTWLDAWPSDDRRTRIVFIGWMLDQTHIERLLSDAEASVC